MHSRNNGKIVVASSVKLKAKEVSCSGWEGGEIRRCRDIRSREMGGQCC